MGEKSDHITDFRPYYCTALNLQGSWFSASDAARLLCDRCTITMHCAFLGVIPRTVRDFPDWEEDSK